MRISPSTKRILIGVAGAFVVLLLLAFGIFQWKRQQLLAYALREVKARVERKYPVTLALGPAQFTNLNTVEIKGMSVVPTARPADTLLTARRLQASLSIRSLFAGRPVFSDLQIQHARLTAHKTTTTDNFSFLLDKKKQPAEPPRDAAQGRNYGLLLNQVLEAGFGNVPGQANFQDFVVRYDSPHHQALLTMPRLKIEDGDISGRLTASVDSVVNELGIDGHIEAGDYALTARVFGVGGSVQLPYVPRRFGALVSFDTVLVRMTGKDFTNDDTGGKLMVRGSLAARNFSLYQPRLGSEDIVVHRGQLDFVASLGRATVALEEGSRVVLNQLVFHPEISVRLKPKLVVRLRIDSDAAPTNAFFASLPEGMFDVVAGTQGTGTLAYHLKADVDLAQVDSLHLNSSLQASKDFRITHFGAEDLGKLNTDFAYTAYNDKGDSLRTFPVGPSNPDFTRYDDVADYLKSAIMTAEDPRFLTHRGFMEKAFINAAIQDIKEKRFARGGSTLSMQLVKNVFLNRQKTVGRKAEEMLIVWLIENTRLVSKQRMFEVYLNIIEWGPSKYRWPSGKHGVYGVKEAALFYYGKRPSELNLPESLYLASIIPKPKYYRYSFNSYGNLRTSTRYFFKLIADIMVNKGLISENDRDNLTYGVNLNGPARSYIVTARDTTRTVSPADSSQFESINLIDLLNTAKAADATPAAPAAPGGAGAPK
ncbi:transglycosylase domain-containing protein [Hymenobacter nivis]|uniref:Penicillin-binding protein n=1 Tax=Hymenobacter nivis TaxID=1850093 RepID=A0A2Z3GPQ5_9BACT|nr:transglycosylase domain-containing protein [Hymenobacter nivis]AWM32965.1 penicillin-binding protein [Hymenobacter nivis]